MTNNYDSNILLGMSERFFHFTETEIRLFQVKDGNRYQVLIQKNSMEDKPSFPKRYDVSDPKTKPVMRGSNWCLNRSPTLITILSKLHLLLKGYCPKKKAFLPNG